MKLRRFISMMLIVTMLTVFAGCGNKDDRTQAAKKLNLSGPITVNVWYNDSAYESYLEFVARQFKKSNELVTVKPVYIEADSYINYIYDESVRNDNACDIYFCHQKRWRRLIFQVLPLRMICILKSIMRMCMVRLQ